MRAQKKAEKKGKNAQLPSSSVHPPALPAGDTRTITAGPQGVWLYYFSAGSILPYPVPGSAQIGGEASGAGGAAESSSGSTRTIPVSKRTSSEAVEPATASSSQRTSTEPNMTEEGTEPGVHFIRGDSATRRDAMWTYEENIRLI